MEPGTNVPRRATALRPDSPPEVLPLADWDHLGAYVLLAEPGAGKTEAFKAMAQRPHAVYVKARDFATLDRSAEWRGKTLYIDGLDEMRADSLSAQGPLHDIRARLDALGRPRFRLSCREADWYGAIDREALSWVAPDSAVTELLLQPLTDDDIRALLGQWPDRVPDAQQFLERALQQGLDALLANPLMLGLLVDAVHGGKQWPSSRAETFKLACKKLATESNDVHRIAARRRRSGALHVLLDDAGLLAAMLLLSGSDGFTLGSSGLGSSDFPTESLPGDLGVMDVDAALSTAIFHADGGRRLARHRSIGEFLAARAIADRVENRGLPIGRVLALMTGHDGGIVEPLRGLNAWLAVHCATERQRLIDRDPLGVVLYGDVRGFSTNDKVHVLQALAKEATQFPWFRSRDWATDPFGALGTSDMAPIFLEGLQSSCREPAHEALLDCALDAIRHGDDMPELLPALSAVIRDTSHSSAIRADALGAWWRQSRGDAVAARNWLTDIRAGMVDDPDDQLSGRLLDWLYPQYLSAREALAHLHAPKRGDLIGEYWMFWSVEFLRRTPDATLPSLLDALVERHEPMTARDAGDLVSTLASRSLAKGLDAAGAVQPATRIYEWLGLSLAEYVFGGLEDDDANAVCRWLAAHPQVHQSVLAHAYAQVRPNDDGHWHFWKAEERLYRAPVPPDWMPWLLNIAAAAPNEPMARYCFERAAHIAISQAPGDDRWMVQVERWVADHTSTWPDAHGWLEREWFCNLDDWRGEELRRKRKYASERQGKRAARRREIEPHLDSLRTGAAPVGLLHQMALAYDKRFIDVPGETPETRVQEFLVGSLDEVTHAIAAFKSTLARADLPTPDEILELDRKGRYHLLRPACLLGATLIERDASEAPLQWTDELAKRLVAFQLTDISNDLPAWFRKLAADRPVLVAEMLVAYAAPKLRNRGQQHLSALWALAHDESMADVARHALPALVQAVPAKTNEHQLRLLNSTLLPALQMHLPSEQARALIDKRLSFRSLDAGQRIAWLVAALNSDGHGRLQELVDFVGSSQSRAAHLAQALSDQSGRPLGAPPLPIRPLARLIELLAPHASPQWPTGAGSVSDADRRRDLVQTFLNQLAASPDPLAGEELARLREMPALRPWLLSVDAARFDHARVIRAASFRHAGASQVASVLANRAPANPKDLAALLAERLREVEERLRGAESSALRLFWLEPASSAAKPRIENECRDILLDRLHEPLLRIGVQIDREASAAFDTRADMRASAIVDGVQIRVPIEVKRENHRHLWTAWREQLDRLYTIDPAARRTGIYLVLWFGISPKATPEGKRPQSPKELEELLRDRLSREEAERLSIVVLDLSLPQARP